MELSELTYTYSILSKSLKLKSFLEIVTLQVIVDHEDNLSSYEYWMIFLFLYLFDESNFSRFKDSKSLWILKFRISKFILMQSDTNPRSSNSRIDDVWSNFFFFSKSVCIFDWLIAFVITSRQKKVIQFLLRVTIDHSLNSSLSFFDFRYGITIQRSVVRECNL